MFQAAKWFDPVLGIDIHVVIVPPSPAPVPLPHPFIGVVFDPIGLAIGAAIGLVFGGGGLVLINGLAVGNTGTEVKAIPHFPMPPGVSFHACDMPPGNEGSIVTGSKTVTMTARGSSRRAGCRAGSRAAGSATRWGGRRRGGSCDAVRARTTKCCAPRPTRGRGRSCAPLRVGRTLLAVRRDRGRSAPGRVGVRGAALRPAAADRGRALPRLPHRPPRRADRHPRRRGRARVVRLARHLRRAGRRGRR